MGLDCLVNWPLIFGQDSWCLATWGWVRARNALFGLINPTWFRVNYPEFDHKVGEIDCLLDDPMFVEWDKNLRNLFSINEGDEDCDLDVDPHTFVTGLGCLNVFRGSFFTVLGSTCFPPKPSSVRIEEIDDYEKVVVSQGEQEPHCDASPPSSPPTHFPSPPSSPVSPINVPFVEETVDEETPLIQRKRKTTSTTSKSTAQKKRKATPISLRRPSTRHTSPSPPKESSPPPSPKEKATTKRKQPSSSRTPPPAPTKPKHTFSSSERVQAFKDRPVFVEKYVDESVMNVYGAMAVVEAIRAQGWYALFVKTEFYLDEEAIESFISIAKFLEEKLQV